MPSDIYLVESPFIFLFIVYMSHMAHLVNKECLNTNVLINLVIANNHKCFIYSNNNFM